MLIGNGDRSEKALTGQSVITDKINADDEALSYNSKEYEHIITI
jgi:hypothetical protein